jgi:ribonuclease HI
MARNLWQAMEEVWPLPDVSTLANTGREWLLHLLDGRSDTVRVMILMTLWRIWYCRNEVVHNKPAPTVEASRRFLCSYLESLLTIKQFPNADAAKGKTVVSWGKEERWKRRPSVEAVKAKQPWRKPSEGKMKMNVDGSFCASSEQGGTGAVLRDEKGSIIVSACRFLQTCRSPLEAELEACLDGIVLSLAWSTQPCVVETDCAEALKLISAVGVDRSPFTGIIQEIKGLLANSSTIELEGVSRDQNSVSHLLANLGRSSERSEAWPSSGPAEIMALCREECTMIT